MNNQSVVDQAEKILTGSWESVDESVVTADEEFAGYDIRCEDPGNGSNPSYT